MRVKRVGALATAGLAALSAGTAAAQTTQPGTPATVYMAHLQPLNTGVTGQQSAGEARLTLTGDTLTISIDARMVPPAIEHWQHFHGFMDNRAAVCPTAAADMNQDGIIDLTETEPMAGTTMVPFDTDPVAMDVAHGSYPTASADGTYHYQQAVSWSALTAAFAKKFAGQPLDLDRRVIFIHGVPPTAPLAASVASLGTIPAAVTLPIACGRIEQVAR